MRERVAEFAQAHRLIGRRQRQFRRKNGLRHRRHSSSLSIFSLFTYNRMAQQQHGVAMAERPRKILICSCEDTIPLDGARVERACRGADVLRGRQLCRAELERVRDAAARGEAITIACTQEAPLFVEIGDAAMTFVNIRETAGWSRDAKAAGPKIAALI